MYVVTLGQGKRTHKGNLDDNINNIYDQFTMKSQKSWKIIE